MAADFNVRFIINDKTQTYVIRLTDASSGYTLTKGLFSITFPDGSTRIKTDFNNPDITSPLGYVDILAVTNASGVLTGQYKIDFVGMDGSSNTYYSSKTFDFNFKVPSNGLVDQSDSIIPQVQFYDSASYSPIGSFTGSVSRTFKTTMPSTSAVSGQVITSSTNTLIPVVSSNYYEGIYAVTNEVSATYNHSTNSWLTVLFTGYYSSSFDVRQTPNQSELLTKINTYKAYIDSVKNSNADRYKTLIEEYDNVVSLYSHLISRYQSGLLSGAQSILTDLLSYLEPYVAHTYKSTPMTAFSLSTNVTQAIFVSNNTTSDAISLGETLTFLSSSGAITYSVGSNSLSIALSLLTSGPISYNNTTGTISITQANTSTSGFLTSTDWNTFNNKQNALTNPITGTGTSGYIPKFNSVSGLTNSSILDNGTAITTTNAITTGGLAAYGLFAPTFTDGIVLDYISGYGRISVGGGDGIQFFNSGVGGALLGSVTSGGDWDFNGNLIIGTGTVISGTVNPILAIAASSSTYIQAYVHNDNAGVSSSSDIACYPDNGVDTSGWIDMGITSSVYADSFYTVTDANEGYLFMSSPSGASKTGNLVFATDSTGTQNYFQWYVGGFTQSKSSFKMQLKSTALDLSVPLNSTVPTGTAPFTVASTTQVANLFATKAASVSDGSIIIASFSATGTPSSSTYLRGDNTWATIPSGSGTVTSVSGTGTAFGLTLTGTVTTSGNLTLGGTLAVPIANITATGTPSATTYLRGDGTWSTVSGSGTVTSVAALTLGTTGTDLSSTVANGTTTPVITLNVPTASATNRGALSSTDWSTFNNKQSAISLTTTGNSGAATFTSNTLNIPTYTLAGLGGQASSTNLTSLSGLTYVSASFVKMTAAGTFTLDTNTYYLASNPNGYTNNTGTVTSVGGTGTAFGLTLTGTVTTTGNLTLGGTLAVPIANITATGTPSASTYLRGDGTWAAVSGSGTVTSVSGTGTAFGLTLTGTVTTSGSLTLGGTLAVPIANITATGTPSSTTYLRGDGTWSTVSGSGTVTSVSGTGTAFGLTLTGTVTTSGSLTLGGTLAVPIANITATGTPSSTTYLRGDGTWSTISGGGITSLNTLTDATQTFAVGTSGTNFNISSATGVHTFNLPDASASNRGVITTGTQTIAGAKTFSSTLTAASTLSINGGVLAGNNIVSMRANATGGQFRIERSDGTLAQYPFYVGSNGNPATYFYATDGTTLRIVFQIDTPSYFYNKLAVGQATWTAASAITEMLEVNGYAKATGFKTVSGTSSQFLKADGTVDSSTYITANQTITLSGAVTGSGTTAITTTLASGVVGISNLSATGTPSSTTYLRGDGTWATPSGSGGSSTLSGLTDVAITTPSDGQLLKYDSASSKWINWTHNFLTSAGTVTSVSGTGTAFGLTLTGTVTTSGSLTLGGTLAVPIANITATGTPSSTTYLRGDGTWSTVSSTFDGILAAGTATTSPLDFTTSGAVLKTSPLAGDMEVDSNGLLYYTHADSSRGVIHSEQFISLTSTYTLTSQTAAQKLFNSTTNGAVTVKAATTYYFECFYTLSSMSATSGSFGFALGGTATFTSLNWTSYAIKATTGTTAATLQTTFNTTAANTTIVTASTQTGGSARITGVIRVNAGGTIIPQVSLGIAAAAIVGINSYFRIIPIGTNTVTSSGNWS